MFITSICAYRIICWWWVKVDHFLRSAYLAYKSLEKLSKNVFFLFGRTIENSLVRTK